MNQKIRQQLQQLSEPEFQKFTSRLMPGVENVMGVRTPELRKLAKQIAKEDFRKYLKEASKDSHEEIMLQGMVIGYAKMEMEELFHYIKLFIPKVDNWSSCDSLCSGLKITKKHRNEMLEFIQPYLKSDREYEIRFGVVMLLTYYADAEHAEYAFAAFDDIHHPGYYVKMAVAWAVSTYFVKLPDLTMEYLHNNRLDDWTYQKALQKITESLKVGQDVRQIIRNMKR